jgi:CRISPR-associated endonuclease Cas2
MDERVIIAYDVADDRRRYHLCRALERYGIRIQYSVFELSLKPKDLHKLGLFRNSRENRTSFNGRLNISNGLARRGSDI